MFKQALLVGSCACAQLVIGVSTAEEATGQDQLPEISVKTQRDEQSTTTPFKGYKASTAQTATKTNAKLIETPQSITVVGSEQIRDQGAQSVTEALRSVAGVDAGQYGRRGQDDFTIRGFTQSEFVLRDGMRMFLDQAWGQTEVFGLERIEVLKGPASVLYGQSAPGGLVNLVSKRPTDKPIAQIGLGYGNYQQKQLSADFSDSLNESGSVRYRLVAISSASDDQVDYADRQRTYIAPSLTWDISDKTSLTLLSSYQKSQYVSIRGLPAAGTVLPNANGRISFSRYVGIPGMDKITTEQTLLGYELTHVFNDNIKFKQNVRYSTFNFDGSWGIGNGNFSSTSTNWGRRSQIRQIDEQSLATDNQLSTQFQTAAIHHDVLLGFDSLHTNSGRDRFGYRNLSSLNLYNPNNSNATAGTFIRNNENQGSNELSQYGFYLQDHLKFAEGWNLVLGLRRDETSLVQKRPFLTTAASRSKTNPGATSGRAGLLYEFSSGFAPYISYTESFMPEIGPTEDGSQLKPITGKQKEAGIKYESPNKRFGANVAIYDIRMENATYTDNNGFTVQVGEQRNRGFEFDITGKLTDKLNIVATYTYIDAEITKAGPRLADQATLGKRPILIPKNIANIWATYDLTSWLPGLSIGAGARYNGEKAGDATNTYTVPDYTVFDAAIYYHAGPWRFALNGRNLSDKQYISGCNGNACYPGDPRMVMFTANYNFK